MSKQIKMIVTVLLTGAFALGPLTAGARADSIESCRFQNDQNMEQLLTVQVPQLLDEADLDSLRVVRRELYSIPEAKLDAMSREDQAKYGDSLHRVAMAILKLEAAELKGVQGNRNETVRAPLSPLESLRLVLRALYSIPEAELDALSREDIAMYGESMLRVYTDVLKLEVKQLRGIRDNTAPYEVAEHIKALEFVYEKVGRLFSEELEFQRMDVYPKAAEFYRKKARREKDAQRARSYEERARSFERYQ